MPRTPAIEVRRPASCGAAQGARHARTTKGSDDVHRIEVEILGGDGVHVGVAGEAG